jgi:aryl sulfotransferase
VGSIVWLASYPKSGNTWLRALLVNYLRDADQPADINDLRESRTGHAASRTTFDELVGVEASALSPDRVDRLRPEVYRRLADEAEADLLLKVHDAWRTESGVELFPRDVTRGVVYLVRNPLDAAVSWAHHLGVPEETAAARMCAQGPVRLESEVHGEQLPQFLGSWSDHVRSWLDASELPLLLVRYEDLHAEPEDSLMRIAAFCGLELDAVRARKAVAFSSFEELRRQEQEKGFRERQPGAQGAFFRRGEVGRWRSELPAPAARRLIAAHRETMARLGYLNTPTETEVPVEAGLSDCP